MRVATHKGTAVTMPMLGMEAGWFKTVNNDPKSCSIIFSLSTLAP